MLKILVGALALMATVAGAQVDLAEAFGAREQIRGVSLSPDGSKLAYIVPISGQGSVLLTYAPGKDQAPKAALTVAGSPNRLGDCKWVSNDRLVCLVWSVDKSPAHFRQLVIGYSRLIALDADGGNQRDLTPVYSFPVSLDEGDTILDWLPDEDGKLLMYRTASGGVERVDTRTLEHRRVEPTREMAFQFLSDGRGVLRVMGVSLLEGIKDNGNRRYYYRKTGNAEWERLGDYNGMTDVGFLPVSVDHERNAVYGFRKKQGRRAIYRISLDGSAREELVFDRADVDVDELIHMGRRRRVIGASYATDMRKAVYFDADLAKLSQTLSRTLPDQPTIRIIDSSMDENILLLLASSDKDPGVYYILDRKTRKMAIFQPVRPQLENMALAKMSSVSYPARDGTMIPAYLTLPVGGAKHLPAIVMPHGGPSARDEWGFDWLAQYYAARGFAVLQPNFRGSAGYGDAWDEENGFKAWPTAIADITDGGRWLIAQNIADPAKLAGVGWSYGGYAVLQSAATDPDLFKAVVSIAPVTDLIKLKGRYKWSTSRRVMEDYIGEGPLVEQGSPARNAGRIKAPVLLVHGTFDLNVEVDHSRLMDKRLGEASVKHKLIIFDKLDHQLEDSALRAQMLRDSDAFLRQSMGM